MAKASLGTGGVRCGMLLDVIGMSCGGMLDVRYIVNHGICGLIECKWNINRIFKGYLLGH